MYMHDHFQKDPHLVKAGGCAACRLASHQWDSGYQDLLQLYELPSLEEHRLHLKLGLIVKFFSFYEKWVTKLMAKGYMNSSHANVIHEP